MSIRSQIFLRIAAPSLAAVLSLSLSLPLRAGATTYYVAPTGLDTNAGTSPDQPYRTIQKSADVMVAGDTVYIKAGTYSEQVVPQHSGNAGSYITYAAYPGETAVIDGSGLNVPEWSGLFEIASRSYILVSGLRITNAVTNIHNPGINVDSSSHILVKGNHVSRTNDSGIAVWNSNNITVDSNEVENVCLGGYNEGISIGGSYLTEVRNNHVHDLGKEGICVKDGSFSCKVFNNRVHHTTRVGIYIDAQDKHTHDIDAFSNIVHDNGSNGIAMASEVAGHLENVNVYNNISHGNTYVGILISDCCIASHPMSNIRIINNTVYSNGRDWGGGIHLANPQATGVVIRNNIVSQNLTFQIVSDADAQRYSADHNLIDGYRGDAAEILGSDYVTGDPMFKHPSSADFHLQPASPAIAMASPTGVPSADFSGHARPCGTDYDIGAFEFCVDMDNCTADLSNNLSLHFPVIAINHHLYWADFAYVPNTLDFTLTNAGPVSDPVPFSGCEPAALSEDLQLHVPALIFDDSSFWADFQYHQGADFMLTGAGLN